MGGFRFLREPRDLDAPASFSGLPADRVRDVVEVLAAHGVVVELDGTVRLADGFLEFTAADFGAAARSDEDAVAIARAAEELEAEASEAGFEFVRIGTSDFGRYVVMRKA
ncbi:hypothetical protein JNUCC0626_41895 [Lentzea sp. JNUCC 0626]|uniref:hypothetical protein n=1 Tax=Lentzea sp. JNUCC 0626 TaxID=3367513 RepID=UPI003749B86C